MRAEVFLGDPQAQIAELHEDMVPTGRIVGTSIHPISNLKILPAPSHLEDHVT